MIELSIVLISKNQAWNIRRLIESVLQATSAISTREIILVDSNSADETVQVASTYPIGILRLRPGLLSPAAGRYIGYQRAQGEFILFLDGDMELLPGWIGGAVRVMRRMPKAGLTLSNKLIELAPPEESAPPPAPEKVRMSVPKEVFGVSFVVGGAALYRRSILEHVGTFNPFLCSDEEPELYLRIRHAGYQILELDSPMVRHFSKSQENLSGLLSRRKRNFLLGVGQCIRYHAGGSLLWPYLKERAMWSLTATLGLAVVLGSLLASLITRDKFWFIWLLLVLSLLVTSAAIRKGSLRRGLLSIFHRLLMVEGLFKGFLMTPFPPDIYPRNFEVVKECKDLSVVRMGSQHRNFRRDNRNRAAPGVLLDTARTD